MEIQEMKEILNMLAVARSNQRASEVSTNPEANREFSYWAGQVEALAEVVKILEGAN